MYKTINDLSSEEIGQILYLSQQSNGRRRLIKNIYNISDETILELLLKYSNSELIEGAFILKEREDFDYS